MYYQLIANDSWSSKQIEFLVKSAMMVVGLIVSVICVLSVVDAKFDHLKNIGSPWGQNLVTAAERDKQLSCLAMNVYREAGHEPFEGKVAVAQVTLNRAASGKFPSEICDVVYQKNIVYEKVVCQFSWYCDGTHKTRPVNTTAYTESMEVAKRVLLENYRLPGLKEALYYHADYVKPNWGKPVVAKIGRHIFYKEKI
jgi:spore germination cell wall hydrolase CwlJ-like protein